MTQYFYLQSELCIAMNFPYVADMHKQIKRNNRIGNLLLKRLHKIYQKKGEIMGKRKSCRETMNTLESSL